MTKPTRGTLRGRIEGLEQVQHRRHAPVVAFYDHETPGDAQAAVERFIQSHGRQPTIQLPYNGREAL